MHNHVIRLSHYSTFRELKKVIPNDTGCPLGWTNTFPLMKLMPSSHLPQTPCDKFIYDFLCNFLGIVGGYRLRRMCSHFVRASCDFFYGASGAIRGKSVQRLCGDCTEIMHCQCSCRAVSATSAQKSYGARAGIVQYHLRHVYGLRSYNFFQICKTSR